MKITQTGASNAPPPTRGGATEQRAGSSFDQLLALHDQARTAAAEGPKSKSERHDRGVRAHGDPQRAHDARDVRRTAADERKAPATDAKAERTPDAPTAPEAADEAPVAEAPVSVAQAAPVPVAAEPVVATVPTAAPAAAPATAEGEGEGEGEGHAQQQAVPVLPVAVAAEGEDAPVAAVPALSAAPAAEVAEQAPTGLPAAAAAVATDARETTSTTAPAATAQPAAGRAPVAADAPAAEQAPAPAEGEQPASGTTAAPAPTGRASAAPVATDRAREVAAPNAAVHDTAPISPVEAAPAPATSPAAALRGPQAAPGLQLAATVERLRDLVQVASRNGAAHARLQLHPAEFGGIEVRLRSAANGVTAKITADRPEAVQALQQAAVELRQSLQERGLTVLDVEVSLASAEGSGAHDAAAQAGGSQSGLDSDSTSDDRRGMDAAPDINDLDDPELGAAPRGDAGAVLVDVLA